MIHVQINHIHVFLRLSHSIIYQLSQSVIIRLSAVDIIIRKVGAAVGARPSLAPRRQQQSIQISMGAHWADLHRSRPILAILKLWIFLYFFSFGVKQG